MEAVCARDDSACQMRALAAALHSLNLYCATITAALMCCCTPIHKHYRLSKRWRGQNVRGIASLILGAAWCCDAASALLRPTDTVTIVAAMMAPLSWLAAAAFHVALWTRRSTAPILYLAIFWMLASASSVTILWQHYLTPTSTVHVVVYIQTIALLMTFLISVVDCVCFYDEVTKRFRYDQKTNNIPNICYKHNDTHFYSKVTFFWLNSLLSKGYKTPLDPDSLGELPENERSVKYYKEFEKIYHKTDTDCRKRNRSLWSCYIRKVWPNFYIAGVLKLFGDMIGVVPPLGLAIIIQYIEGPIKIYDHSTQVTIEEYLSNGYVMLLIITLALISQAFLSQNSTHLVTVEGTRLKTALQSMVYDKCMRLAPWTPTETNEDEETRLLHDPEENSSTRSGLITNLVSQDTYNIMSCVWICHYIWAIPLKVVVILYLLYTKLGISAIIGTVASVLIITPLQFFIGKKISDNSKDIAKCTDHRISKMTEIIQGIDVIKLYVWENLFKEKILQLREVELKLLNKDSIYWSFLTFTTQISSILITVITFTAYYFIETNNRFTAVNVFAALALFNQLTVPLLILPVTVLMVIQAMVSTKRIQDFLELPESNNILEDKHDDQKTGKLNDSREEVFCEISDKDEADNEAVTKDESDGAECVDQFSDDEVNNMSARITESIVSFKNAALTWGKSNDMLLEVDDLDIPAGKLIMVVGATGSGKSSLLSAILGEMYLDRGDIIYNRFCTKWYAGQPPWLLEGTVRNNIVMDNPWCQRKYGRVLRATGLRPDLQLLPEGDATQLGSHGAPLSGGQRIRVCVARALYSDASLLALDEPLAALDAPLARHLVARALVPAARAGRTVVVATNRLELLHYADLIIAMEEGRVCGVGRAAACSGALARWAQLADEARAAAARAGAGPPGGAARERSRLVRALSRVRFQRCNSEETTVGISEAAGAHLLSEVPTCAGGSWRRRVTPQSRPPLSRQLSSPPPSMYNSKWRPDVRRAVSADESNSALQREASFLRRLLRPRPTRTLNRWTPRTLRRLISSDSEGAPEDSLNNDVPDETGLDTTPYSSLTSNGVDTNAIVTEDSNSDQKSEDVASECTIWWEYARACKWWGGAYWAAAVAAQALALAADCWLTYTTAQTSNSEISDQQTWRGVRTYAAWCGGGALAAGAAGAASAAAGAAARRALHERLLHATLRASYNHHRASPIGTTLHRFAADILVIDKKLPTAISRWAQLALLCTSAMLVNAVVAPWSLLASLPALLCYLMLQSVYLCNARELQCAEAQSAGSVVSMCAETCAGGSTIRAGRLQARMRTAFLRRLDTNHNTLLLLNAANRWLGLTLDLVGAASVSVLLCVSLCGAGEGGSGAAAGLAGAYSLLLPAYLAHLAKCRADLHLQLAALERVHTDTNVPQEDYRDDLPIPAGWQRNGKIEFENVSVQHEPGTSPILNNINLTISPGEKVAICGRSGSGKSTLLMTCAGATTICGGRVLVDGQDITRVPLRALRHRVVVVPQEPAMFSGTLRENLDPLAVHTDDEIWTSLRAVGLFDFVSAQSAGLECGVSGRGGWSAGRVCRAAAARAALHARPAAALLLDEPAAALDAPAERALLAALAAVAPHTTLVTVAHRISSVRGYSRGVVLEARGVAEQGDVAALLAQPASRLARMLAAAQRYN